jgi:glutamine amidotransferase
VSEFKIALLDYGMGNLRSVCRALEHSGGQVDVVSEPFDEAMYQAIVFPGQGAMVQCMRHLKLD